MVDNLYALIMAGGGGTRLWPMSRQAHPKQMLKLVGDRSMFQLAVDRLVPLLPHSRILVVTAGEQVEGLAAQVPELPRENFIVEPLGRGTASCIGLAALHLHRRDPGAVMAVLTADHYIRRTDRFREVLRAAHQVAEEGYLVTLGIEPTHPATGYGYIRRGAGLGQAGDFDYYAVEAFVEKPDAERALAFLAAETYAWNSGMFIWRTQVILDAIAGLMPDLDATLTALGAALDAGEYASALAERWPALKKETIDYGIMERAERVAVIPVDLGWSDVGAWDAVMALRDADDAGNALSGDVIALDTENSMIMAEGQRLVTAIGVRDLVVVDTPDALLISRRNQTQRVRDVVQRLREAGRDILL